MVKSSSKKQVLQMIENGIFVITTKAFGRCFGSTITWVTQTSFSPPLLIVALKVGSGIYNGVKNSNQFAIHMLSQDQESFAASFFRPSKSDDQTINGHSYTLSDLGNPLLDEAVGIAECKVKRIVEEGDHHVVVGEVVNAYIRKTTGSLSLKDTGWIYSG